jgi:hypothetical protein
LVSAGTNWGVPGVGQVRLCAREGGGLAIADKSYQRIESLVQEEKLE